MGMPRGGEADLTHMGMHGMTGYGHNCLNHHKYLTSGSHIINQMCDKLKVEIKIL
jgi:hypothetical protein